MILVLLFVIVLTSLLIWKASEWISRGAEYIGRGWSPGVRGATISAISSSLPELFVALVFLGSLRDSAGFVGGLSTMTGSAIFNILLIPALMGAIALSANTMKNSSIERKVVLRDGAWLLAVQSMLYVFLVRGSFGFLEALVLLGLYGLYLWRLIRNNRSRSTQIYSPKGIGAKVWRMVVSGVVVLGGACFILVEGCVRLSEIAGWSIASTALIVAAAATSLPDTFISIRDVMKGAPVEGVSNAIGSNIFDLCVALGLPILIYSVTHGTIQLSEAHQTQMLSLWKLMMGITFVATLVLYLGKRLTWVGTVIFFAIYLGFVSSVVMGMW